MRVPGSNGESAAHVSAFATTHWSVVLAAGDAASPAASAALEQLCHIYSYPLYAYVRRRGYSPEDAQDLTQGFFTRLLARNDFSRVHPRKGKFRSFLLAALQHFLSDQRDRAQAAKRGGQAESFSLDALSAEARYQYEPADRMDAERIYERRWAMTLLDRALTRLGEESVAAGKGEQFERLRGFVAGESDVSCHEAASRLGQTESAVKSVVHRLRERYRALVREEIAQTVADPAEIDAEIRYLIDVVSR